MVGSTSWRFVAFDGPQVVYSRDEEFYTSSGTSLAAPVVAANAARIVALAPSLSGAELKRLLVIATEIRDDWSAHVEAGGIHDASLALHAAVVIERVRGGADRTAALDELCLTAAKARASTRPRSGSSRREAASERRA